MTEKDLWRYKEAKKNLALARERLQEFMLTAYEPSSPNLTGVHGGADTDQAGFVAQRRTALESDLNVAKEYYAQIGIKMDGIAAILDDDEQEFFLSRYILCLTWDATKVKMHSSKDRLVRIKRGILQKIRDL